MENGKDWKMDINFEQTGAGTPQRNHLEESGFTMIGARERNLDTPCQCGIYNEVKVVQGCVSNTTMKYGFSVIDIYRKQATSVFKRVDSINAC